MAKQPEVVVFHWTRDNGECYDCGLPAAFFTDASGGRSLIGVKLCAVCAANHAADGETISRIAPEDS